MLRKPRSPLKYFYRHFFCIQFAFLFFVHFAHAQDGEPYRVCIDIGGSDSETKASSDEKLFSSAKIDLVREAFKLAGLAVKFVNDGPWNRCLNDVANGNIDFAMGAFYDKERAKIFDFSDHYNTLTPTIFFLSSKDMRVEKIGDLAKLRGCGIYGYSYAHYKLPKDALDLTYDYGSIYRKVVAGRCDYFPDELESVADPNNDVNFLDSPLIKHTTAKWAIAPSTHLITQKNGKGSAVLKKFNAGLKVLIESGQAAKIWKDGMGNVAYRP